MLGLGSTQLPDDRGRLVDVWTPTATDTQTSEETPSDMPRAVIDRVQSAWRDSKYSLMRAPITRENRAFFLLGGAACGLLVVGLIIAAVFSGGSPIAVGVATFMFAAFCGALQRSWRKRRLGAAVRETLVAEGLCASCGYRLNGLAAEPDGCTVCPECSAAWKLSAHAARASDQRSPTAPAAPNDSNLWLRLLTMGRLGRPRVLATLDDAGRLVELVDPAIRKHPPVGWPALSPARQTALAHRLRWMGWWRRVIFAVGTLFYASFSFVMLRKALQFTPTLSIGYFGHIMPVIFLTWFTLMFVGLVFRPPIRDRRKYADLFLDENLCPCCLADLASVPTSPAGLSVCPTCGASWKAASFVRTGTSSATDTPAQ